LITRLWTRAAIGALRPALLTAGGRPVLLADGIKIPKAGRKTPAVKKPRQEPDGNTKPEHIFGHSCQAVALAVKAGAGFFALPPACRIHEGAVFGNRNAVRRKLRAYHCHIRPGVIAQGLLQALAVLAAPSVWRGFGSWLRTVRAGVPPSERVVALALRNALPEFLADSLKTHILAKFIRRRLDLSRAEGLRLAS